MHEGFEQACGDALAAKTSVYMVNGQYQDDAAVAGSNCGGGGGGQQQQAQGGGGGSSGV